MTELGRKLSGHDLNGWIAFYEIDARMKERVSKGDTPQAALEYLRAYEELRSD